MFLSFNKNPPFCAILIESKKQYLAFNFGIYTYIWHDLFIIDFDYTDDIFVVNIFFSFFSVIYVIYESSYVVRSLEADHSFVCMGQEVAACPATLFPCAGRVYIFSRTSYRQTFLSISSLWW